MDTAVGMVTVIVTEEAVGEAIGTTSKDAIKLFVPFFSLPAISE